MRGSAVFRTGVREVAGLSIARRGNAPKGARPQANGDFGEIAPCLVIFSAAGKPGKRVQLCLNHDIGQPSEKQNTRERVSRNPVP